MWEDPIVAEVHRAREKLAAECNYDIDAFFAGVRKRQALRGARLIPQKNGPNQWVKLTPVPRGQRRPRRPRQLSLMVRRTLMDYAQGMAGSSDAGRCSSVVIVAFRAAVAMRDAGAWRILIPR
jgi:hypothetical protein